MSGGYGLPLTAASIPYYASATCLRTRHGCARARCRTNGDRRVCLALQQRSASRCTGIIPFLLDLKAVGLVGTRGAQFFGGAQYPGRTSLVSELHCGCPNSANSDWLALLSLSCF